MNLGIVGHEAAKFTVDTEKAARREIQKLLGPPDSVCVSGVCHLGGIDIWAEEEAIRCRRDRIAFPARRRTWEGFGGYKERNIKIATVSEIVYVIVVSKYPDHFMGKRFNGCYHCHTHDHVKSGGCWTARYAVQELGKEAAWIIL